MSANKLIAASAVEELKAVWNDRLPTWEEYLEAHQAGRVRGNKTIAATAIHATPVPMVYKVIYGIITMWLGLLLVPAAIVAWFFASINVWWILGAVVVSGFLISVSREGHCEGMKAGAARSEEFYEHLVAKGAFLFMPSSRKA